MKPLNEVPVGCILVDSEDKVLCKIHNLTNKLKDPLAYAEYLCIEFLIQNNINIQSLSNLTFYISIEPCAICAGVLERINATVIFGYHNDIFGSQEILNTKIWEMYRKSRGS